MLHIDQQEFDLIVLGTGLIESVVAAAAAKAGSSVLQLDPGACYGGAWATLHLDELLAALGSGPPHTPDGLSPPLRLSPGRVLRRPGAALGPSRDYNLDLAAKVLFGAGGMISLLLGSGAHHYTEFKLVQGSYLYRDGQLREVPSTRAEIFRDRSLSPLQKRVLMRFLKAAVEAMQGAGPLAAAFDGRPFSELMQQEGLDGHLQQSLAHGVLLLQRGADSVTCEQALQLMQQYVESAGRYGPDAGPFLTPMYGCGELPQAFCRAAAVAGAVQVLRCPVQALGFDEPGGRCTGVELGSGQVIRCHHLAGGAAALHGLDPSSPPLHHAVVVQRCVAVLAGPLRPGEQQTLVALPPGAVHLPDGSANSTTVWALGLCHSTLACPQGRWVVHLWAAADGADSAGGNAAHALLLPALEALAECTGLADEGSGDEGGANRQPSEGPEEGTSGAAVGGDDAARPGVLLAAFFTAHGWKAEQGGWPANVVCCPDPGPEVTFSGAVEDAKRCYWALFPEAEGQPFPLDRPGEGAPGQGVDSDEEELQALQAALGAGAEEQPDGVAAAGDEPAP